MSLRDGWLIAVAESSYGWLASRALSSVWSDVVTNTSAELGIALVTDEAWLLLR